jgi:outer membrane protein assembly factor BamC
LTIISIARIFVNPFSKVTLLGISVSLCACSALETDKVDYRSVTSTKAPSLDVPPDLTQLSRDTRYVVVDGAVSASSLPGRTATTVGKSSVAASSVGDVRIERSGNQRWLVVARPAEKLWDPLKEFWQENGFNLVKDQSDLGIMETDWAENRAKIPQDMIRSTIGKLFDGLYSTPERDKFRTRVERNTQGETEIFVTHRGVMEIYTTEAKDQTVWQSRPADTELETEFLRRLMVKLGVGTDSAKTMVASSGATKPLAVVASENGKSVVRVQEGFDRAWRRVGLALDRAGFTVEDRDRKKGIYFVRYVAAPSTGNETGFLAKLFSSSNKTGDTQKYQILVLSQGDVTTVSVHNEQGAPDGSETANRILKIIADDVK